ncbi:MAG: cytochrome c oxidase subunit II [Thermoanaerobaculia bacterium]|nr:cytochrome c oxidase subunit II [Thermoanaerobaculia bacterium]
MWPEIPLFPRRASELAREIDALYFTALGITFVFSVLIAGFIFYLGWRYHRVRDDQVGDPQQAPNSLEIVWSVVPLVILMGMFGWGAKIYLDVRRPPADAVEYYVVGKQWMWKIQHPSGPREINELHVPLGEAVKLTMTSEDVIHSFYVPELRVKADVVPGRYTTLWFRPDRAGEYRLFCAEYCGAEHSLMMGRVVVLEPRDYQRWLAGTRDDTTTVSSGEELFAAKACDTCHRPGSSLQAPDLQGIFETEVVFEDGSTAIADNAYLRESILNPAARVVAGYEPKMPVFQGQLSEEELLALLTYIKSL